MSKKAGWRPFADARTYVRTLGLKTQADYQAWAKSEDRPSDIPVVPRSRYASEWRGWADWLGNEGVVPRRLLKAEHLRPFTQAREFVRSLGFKRQADFYEWSKTPQRPTDIPSNPRAVYDDEWTGWADWLGTGLARQRQGGQRLPFLPFLEARTHVHGLGFKRQAEWQAWAKSEA